MKFLQILIAALALFAMQLTTSGTARAATAAKLSYAQSTQQDSTRRTTTRTTHHHRHYRRHHRKMHRHQQ